MKSEVTFAREINIITGDFMKINLEVIVFTALFGFVVGALAGLSVRHPVQSATIAKYDTICTGTKPKIYQTTLTGEIYAVKCDNGTLLRINH